MATRSRAHFTRETFRFLAELALNNEKPWFEENKDRYVEHVKEPLLRFIADFQPRLTRISKAFVADPKPGGGSMFRIHRDVRFSKDKSPYKTHAAAQFRHVSGKDVHAPGFYLHLEPGSVFAGGGMWRPDREALQQIRERIAKSPAAWKKVVQAEPFVSSSPLGGESLKRPPKGVEPDHPLIEDLKRKDFVATVQFKDSDALKPDFVDRYAEACESIFPLLRFLCGALDLKA